MDLINLDFSGLSEALTLLDSGIKRVEAGMVLPQQVESLGNRLSELERNYTFLSTDIEQRIFEMKQSLRNLPKQTVTQVVSDSSKDKDSREATTMDSGALAQVQGELAQLRNMLTESTQTGSSADVKHLEHKMAELEQSMLEISSQSQLKLSGGTIPVRAATALATAAAITPDSGFSTSIRNLVMELERRPASAELIHVLKFAEQELKERVSDAETAAQTLTDALHMYETSLGEIKMDLAEKESKVQETEPHSETQTKVVESETQDEAASTEAQPLENSGLQWGVPVTSEPEEGLMVSVARNLSSLIDSKEDLSSRLEDLEQAHARIKKSTSKRLALLESRAMSGVPMSGTATPPHGASSGGSTLAAVGFVTELSAEVAQLREAEEEGHAAIAKFERHLAQLERQKISLDAIMPLKKNVTSLRAQVGELQAQVERIAHYASNRRALNIIERRIAELAASVGKIESIALDAGSQAYKGVKMAEALEEKKADRQAVVDELALKATIEDVALKLDKTEADERFARVEESVRKLSARVDELTAHQARRMNHEIDSLHREVDQKAEERQVKTLDKRLRRMQRDVHDAVTASEAFSGGEGGFAGVCLACNRPLPAQTVYGSPSPKRSMPTGLQHGSQFETPGVSAIRRPLTYDYDPAMRTTPANVDVRYTEKPAEPHRAPIPALGPLLEEVESEYLTGALQASSASQEREKPRTLTRVLTELQPEERQPFLIEEGSTTTIPHSHATEPRALSAQMAGMTEAEYARAHLSELIGTTSAKSSKRGSRAASAAITRPHELAVQKRDGIEPRPTSGLDTPDGDRRSSQLSGIDSKEQSSIIFTTDEPFVPPTRDFIPTLPPRKDASIKIEREGIQFIKERPGAPVTQEELRKLVGAPQGPLEGFERLDDDQSYDESTRLFIEHEPTVVELDYEGNPKGSTTETHLYAELPRLPHTQAVKTSPQKQHPKGVIVDDDIMTEDQLRELLPPSSPHEISAKEHEIASSSDAEKSEPVIMEAIDNQDRKWVVEF